MSFLTANQAQAGKETSAGWFTQGAVECSLGAGSVNLGLFSRITDPTPSAEGNLNVKCSSNAYPLGYDHGYKGKTVQGGYCLTISGKRELQGQDKNNKNLAIPFDFYNATHKSFDPNRPQDFDIPIGDGKFGIVFIDWDYTNGEEHEQLDLPWRGGRMYDVPVAGLFKVKISPTAANRVWPAGTYRNTFIFNWVAGVPHMANDYPKVTEGPRMCNRWPGVHRTGATTVELRIEKYCEVKTIRHIDFGRQAFLDKYLEKTGEFTADCSEGTKYGVGIDYGLNAGGSQQRAMKREGVSADSADREADYIKYDLYQLTGRSKPWRDVGDRDNIYKGTGTAEAKTLSVYAVVPPQKDKPAGKYSDTVQIRIIILDPGE